MSTSYHPVSTSLPTRDEVAVAVKVGYQVHRDLDDPYNAVVKAVVTPAACQLRAMASWGGPDMRENTVVLLVESTIPLDLTNLRDSDRFLSSGVELLQDMARDVQREVRCDVLVHAINSTYATRDLDDRPFILHLTPVLGSHGVGHSITYVGERSSFALNVETNDVLGDEDGDSDD